MKYVILIHSHPEPWGHPTPQYTAEGRQLSPEQHDQMSRDFELLLTEVSVSGELITAEALGDPAHSRFYTAGRTGPITTDGPYAEAKEQLAGFFLFDFATQERAEEIAARFASPGDTVELRPIM
ncbi:YciI family protein [Kribbella sp. CA-293567]|uniref:YciI family protein n=1 Tax=Kribbella sp. CA-293567 TaxID=3002436 RepID=UPI0022DDFD5E|nr:YciI family protein [Kribbella sp. CA-293567]WBQ07207.1 YciI family protein [Kribbella sp. CA-293567]